MLLRTDTMTRESEAEKNAGICEIIKTRDFSYLYLISFCQIFYGYYIISMYKTLGTTKIRNDQLLTTIGSVGSLFNGVSRIFWSSLLDCFAFNKVYRTLLFIQILCITLLEWSLNFPWLYFIVICVSMMCEGAITSILPTETLKHFGTKRGSQIYSYMFSSFGVSAITGSILVALLQYEIGYTGMLYLCLALTLIAFLLTFVY